MHGGKLAVHHDDAIGSDRDRDITAGTLQHIGLVAEVSCFHLDLGEIDVLLRKCRAGKQRRRGRQSSQCVPIHFWISSCGDEPLTLDGSANWRWPTCRHFKFEPPCEPEDALFLRFRQGGSQRTASGRDVHGVAPHTANLPVNLLLTLSDYEVNSDVCRVVAAVMRPRLQAPRHCRLTTAHGWK